MAAIMAGKGLGGLWFGATIALWVVGLAGLFGLPLLVKEVRLDENALLPLLAEPTFTRRATPAPSRRGGSARERLQASGFRSETHAYAASHDGGGSGERCELLSTTLRGKSNPQHQAMVWIADEGLVHLTVELMALLDESNWLSRDVIFLHANFSEACEPTEAVNDWLASYHLARRRPGSRVGSVRPAGNIAAAVVLTHQRPPASSQDLLVRINSGGSGLLPNLDLLTAFRTVQGSLGGVSLALDAMEPCETQVCAPPATLEDYARALTCLRQFYAHHWLGGPEGHHYRFRTYGVDALELRIGREFSIDSRQSQRKEEAFIRILESFARSLNNVEEKLHHSTYTYLLVNSSCCVSSPLAWVWFLVALLVANLAPALICRMRMGAERPTARPGLAATSAEYVAMVAGASAVSLLIVCLACLALFREPLRAYLLCLATFPLNAGAHYLLLPPAGMAAKRTKAA